MGTRGQYLQIREFAQIISDITKKPFNELRIVDLGCWEGFYAKILADLGAKVVGIEGRTINIEIAKKHETNNLVFYQDDVKNFSIEKYGIFDVILGAGILYHLDFISACLFLEEIYKSCMDLLILDTNCSDILPSEYKDLKPAVIEYKGVKYGGVIYEEPIADLSPKEIENKRTSALSNEWSFWFGQQQLCNLLVNIGFTTVYRTLAPRTTTAIQRATIVAIKGKNINIEIKESNKNEIKNLK